MYKVKISGEEIGYIQNKQGFEEKVKAQVIENETKNVDTITLAQNPEYELKLVDRTQETNEEEITHNLENDVLITYKYYEIAVNDETVDSVDYLEEAEEIVNNMKEETQDIDLTITEKYSDNSEEINTNEIEVAKTELKTKVEEKKEEVKKQKEEEERISQMPEINGIKLAYTPISGTITSRYGVSSRIRSSQHTGLDIGAPTGTNIQAVAGGTVTNASRSGAYGNLVKIDHGNGVETWYAHTSKMYVKVGDQVSAGDIIAAVGSTGNSTGPHLHLEIRINGEHVNPQNYLYK